MGINEENKPTKPETALLIVVAVLTVFIFLVILTFIPIALGLF